MQALLAHAAAQGRRDGLSSKDPQDSARWQTLEMPAPSDLPAELRAFMQIALWHCYTTGHRHGAEVRRENDRRLSRQEPPLASLSA
ncbi:hypothetical protein [Teichococcus aestuarii]|uniref:hypothetical protein n=1 Tax=Teichococcus aestuarii TaxID=568898 RepID=UPI00360F8FDC